MDQIETVRTHWAHIGTPGRLPSRSAVRSDALGDAVPWTFLLEPINGRLVFRIAGTLLCETFGLDMRELEFARVWSDAERATIDRTLGTAIDRASEAFILSETVSVRGRKGQLEVACFPVRCANGSIAFLGAMNHEPRLPSGLDRVARVRILPGPKASSGADSLAESLAALAVSRSAQVSRTAARRLRDAGVIPTLAIVSELPKTKR